MQAVAVKALLGHRLSGKDSATAKIEWIEIVDGEHRLWREVGQSYKHTIRAFLVYFNTQIQRHPDRFNFRNGSVGALALTTSYLQPPTVCHTKSLQVNFCILVALGGRTAGFHVLNDGDCLSVRCKYFQSRLASDISG